MGVDPAVGLVWLIISVKLTPVKAIGGTFVAVPGV
jgi:hypothetical protein